jgi:hypothetical protein
MSDAHGQGHAEEGFGVALGFRIFESEGELYMAEAEISAYVDDPNALGATLVFHSLTDLDPIAVPGEDEDEEEDMGWRTDIDEELTRDESAPMQEQFQAILRQLAAIPEGELQEYLQRAREESGMEEEE